MRIGAAIALVVALSAACRGAGGGLIFREYEYEEEMYLALDGSATLYVNASVPALNLLRGSTFDERPNARLDREAIREYFTSPVTRVTRVSATRRNNRRYFHVRIDVTDVRALGSAPPFAWSTYSFRRDGALFVYQQTIGAAAAAAASSLPQGHAGWNGGEITAFRLHLPSRVVYHNTDGVQRGNILSWEQPLSERLARRAADARCADGDGVDSLQHAAALRRERRSGGGAVRDRDLAGQAQRYARFFCAVFDTPAGRAAIFFFGALTRSRLFLSASIRLTTFGGASASGATISRPSTLASMISRNPA